MQAGAVAAEHIHAIHISRPSEGTGRVLEVVWAGGTSDTVDLSTEGGSPSPANPTLAAVAEFVRGHTVCPPAEGLSIADRLAEENSALEEELQRAQRENATLRRFARSTVPPSLRAELSDDVGNPDTCDAHLLLDAVRSLRAWHAQQKRATTQASMEEVSVAALGEEAQGPPSPEPLCGEGFLVEGGGAAPAARPASAQGVGGRGRLRKMDRTTQLASVDRLYTKDMEKRRRNAQRRKECERQAHEAQWGRGVLTALQQEDLAKRLCTDHQEHAARVASRLRETYLPSPERVCFTKDEVAQCNDRLFYSWGKKAAETRDRLVSRHCRELDSNKRVLSPEEMVSVAVRLSKPWPRSEAR